MPLLVELAQAHTEQSDNMRLTEAAHRHHDWTRKLIVQGIWRLAVHNPMRTYPLAFNLTVSKEAFCLNNCSGHGTCSQAGSASSPQS